MNQVLLDEMLLLAGAEADPARLEPRACDHCRARIPQRAKRCKFCGGLQDKSEA